MNRDEYMKELEQALKRLPKEEREETLLYYREYFEDAGPESDADVIEELGPAKETAAQILKEVAIKRLDEPRRAAKKGLSTVWVVILALCAAPIGLPLLLAVLICGLALAITVFAVFVTLLFVGIVLVAAGVVSAAAGIWFLSSQAANAIYILGTAFGEVGVGLLLIVGGCVSCKGIFQGMAKGVKKMLARGDQS